MTTGKIDSEIISKIFARTPSDLELTPNSWLDLFKDIVNFGKSCNGLISIIGEEGSGKTTFIKQLIEKASVDMDCLHILPLRSESNSGWILNAIRPWLSSDRNPSNDVSAQFRQLGESLRPILLCIDGADTSEQENLPKEILALLNLADASDIKLTIILLTSNDLAALLKRDKHTSTRIVYESGLPSFNDEEIANFIQRKLMHSFGTQQKVSGDKIIQITKDSRGTPGLILHHLAAAFGHKPGISGSQQPKNVPTSKPHKSTVQTEQFKIYALEELLAPPKN